MKKNFYLQHPLMAMFDPRMKQLVNDEGLKGVGAYWVIIEKLSLLPEPRAQLDYLRIYCDKKIRLGYLKKIIWEYDLFELEEDGYFMPKELNPPRKKEGKATSEKQDSQTRKEGKTAKATPEKTDSSRKKSGKATPEKQDSQARKEEKTTSEKPNFQARKEEKATSEKPVFQTKNDGKTAKNDPKKPVFQEKDDENQQKMTGNRSENPPENSSNTLNFKHLRKNSSKIDNNTVYNINITTSASTEEKEEAAAEDVLSSPKTTPTPIEPWHVLISKLAEESAWLDVACMHSGYGGLLKRRIKEAAEVFRQHVVLHDNGNALLNLKDVRQYFVNFVRAGQRTSQELHTLLLALERQQQAAAPPDPHRYEQRVNGKRTYLGCPIPDDAPPRPDNTAFWNETTRSWFSSQRPSSPKKPMRKPV